MTQSKREITLIFGASGSVGLPFDDVGFEVLRISG